MGHVVLVRHGRAAAAFDADTDPGLDEAGQRQADQMASGLVLFGPLPLYSSPLRRCVETAQALAGRWGVEPVIDPGVGEVVAPTDDLAGRGAWLRQFMRQKWTDQPRDLVAWRDSVLDAVRKIGGEGDAVVVSHFIAINAVVGHATGDDRVVCFAPDNCSRTEVKVDGDAIEVVELGGQARTLVQ
jgi:broad specificity phosphatase PhoE